MLRATSRTRASITLVSLAVLVLLSLTLCGCETSALEQSAEHVYSHRGASGEEVEHSIAAYDLALLYGSKYIEQDVVLSADGTLWISHDRNAKRITGTDSKYSDLTDEQIRALRTEDGQSILTLDEVFSKYKDQATFVVELKSGANAVDAFSELVRKHGVENNVIVQCGDISVLRQLADAFPNMRRLLLLSDIDELESVLEEACVDIISVNKEYLSEDVC